MSVGLDEVLKFEEHADSEIAKISLWRQPIRTLLSLIYLSADGQYVGGRFARGPKQDDEVGTAMITRMSYVMQYFKTCDRRIGHNIDDALSVVDQGFQFDIAQMLGYAHFCEIMPLVRRGFFAVEREPGMFVLKHPSENFRQNEELDILMSEMVLAHDLIRFHKYVLRMSN